MLGLTAAHNSNYYTADNGYVHDTICGLISECITMHAVYLIVYSTHCSRYCTSVQCRHKAGQYTVVCCFLSVWLHLVALLEWEFFLLSLLVNDVHAKCLYSLLLVYCCITLHIKSGNIIYQFTVTLS